MDYNDAYETCGDTYATLCIYSEDLRPVEITEMLGVEPTKAQKKGEICWPRKAVCKVNAWFLSSKDRVESKDSRRHIDWILDQVSDKSNIFESLRRKGCRTEVSCYWLSMSGHDGPILSPAQMKPLAACGLDCWYDIYFSSDEDEA
jgi:hypothetical protein